MTSPAGGGSANLGTVSGKVRITYESSNARTVTKDLENVQNVLQGVGSSATKSAKDVDRAGGVLSQFGRMLDRFGQRTVANPAQGLGQRVENETNRATKALASLQRSAQRGTNLSGSIKLVPTKVDIDPRGFQAAIRNARLGTLSVTAPLKLAPSSVVLDNRAIENAVRNVRMSPITLRVPVTVTPSNTTGGGSGGLGGGGLGAALSGAGLARMIPTLGGVGAAAGVAAAAVVGIGAAATGAALAIGKGFGRLTAIDDARKKLSAMGKTSQEINRIEASALKSVDKTRFGLQEGFATAADAINAGVKSGKDLDKYLQATANTAALAGTGMQELGTAFSRAAVQGKLTGEIAQMLYDRQVPLLNLLATEYGVTQQKAQQMISNGEVGFDRFINAMSKSTDAAKIMGNTIGGSFSNLMASVSRLGANLLAPLFGVKEAGDATLVATAIQQVTKAVDWLGKTVKDHSQGVVSFFTVIADGSLIAVHGFALLVSFISDAVVKITEIVGDATGWLSTAFAEVADFLGADGVAKNAREFSDAMHDLGTGLRENRDLNNAQNFKNIENWKKNVDQWEQSARDAAKANKDLGDEADSSTTPLISLTDALEKLQIKADSATTALEGTNEQFKDFLKQVKEKGGTDQLVKVLSDIRNQFQNGGRQVKNFATALEGFRDASQSAGDRADKLISALKELNLIPNDQGLSAYNEKLAEMTSYMSDIIDHADAMGSALVKSDGSLDLNFKNSRSILNEIDEIQQKSLSLMAEGFNPDEVYEQSAKGLLDVLQRQAGLSPEEAQKVLAKYFSKEAFVDSIKSGDPKTALENMLKDDPAKLDSVLNLLTTTQDILKQIVGPDGKLHVPMVADVSTNTGTSSVPSVSGIPAPAGAKLKPGAQPFIGPVGAGDSNYINIDGKLYKASDVDIPGQDSPGVVSTPGNTTQRKIVPSWGGPGVAYGPWMTDTNKIGEVINSAKPKYDADIDAGKVPQEFADTVNKLIAQAESQGKSLSEAFAEGIKSGDKAVEEALLRLAQYAPDVLGNSPAKYGPLSGKGWTLFRGKKFTQDWAKGIVSEANSAAQASEAVAGSAAGGLSATGAMPLNDQITQVLKDLQEFSDFGKHLLDFGNQISEIAFGVAKFANDMSGGTLFPKSYVKDPNYKDPGSNIPAWNPTKTGLNVSTPSVSNSQSGIDTSTVPQISAGPAKTGNADSIQRAIIAKAQSMNFNKEQILAALGIANQETAYGTNPRTNDIQNQNGTPGITGVYQQDMQYRKYGDPRDPNNAITGFLTEFAKRGQGLNNPNPWDQAVNKVQIPADAGKGGYRDADGTYLKNLQRAQALEVYNRIVGSGSVTTTATNTPAPTTQTQTPSVPKKQRPNGPAPTGQTWDYEQGKWVSIADYNNKQSNTQKTSGTTTQQPGNGGLLAGLDLSGKGVNLAGANGQIALVAAIAKKFGLTMTSGKDDHDADGGWHPRGQAGDFSNGQGNTPQQAAFAKFMSEQFGSYIEQLIYSDPNAAGVNLYGGKPVPQGQIYDANTLKMHRNHVHIAVKDQMAQAFSDAVSKASGIDVSALVAGVGDSRSAVPTTIVGPAQTALGSMQKSLSGFPVQQAKLQELIDQNPILSNAMQNQASLTRDSVVPVLQEIDGLISQQNKIGTDESKAVASSLGQMKQQFQSQFGLQEGPTALDQAQTLANGVSSIASSIFGLFDQGLKTIGATQDIANTLVRGVANTKDVTRLIDNAQEFITLFQKGFQTASDITGFASQLAGMGGADPSGAGGAVAGGLSAASALTGLIAQGLAAANTAIDIGQEAYAITTKYVGRFIQSWTGLSGASDVKYLLDEVTGQVQAYSSDNPQQKTTFNTLGRELGASYGNRQAPQNNFHIYQGPGQDPRDTMDDAMFTIRSSGQGAFGYAV